MELSRRMRPRSITLAQRQECVEPIAIGGLDNVVDVRSALSEQLNVVESTNTKRCALHEACLGSLEKLEKIVAYSQKCALQFGICSTLSRLANP